MNARRRGRAVGDCSRPAVVVARVRRLADVVGAYAAPVLLVALALIYLVRIESHDQAVWPGLSFGMFSTVDTGHTRFVRIVLAPSTDSPIPISPSSLSESEELARVVPSDANLIALGEAVLRREAASELDDLSVSVEVWSVSFDHSGPTIRAEVLNSVVVGS